MNIVIDVLIDNICISYIDDISVFAETKGKHDENFKTVKEDCASINLKRISLKEY
jgi:hypothetical protein